MNKKLMKVMLKTFYIYVMNGMKVLISYLTARIWDGIAAER